MAFNIRDFSATLNRYGIAKSNLFFAAIALPSSVRGGDSMSIRDLSMYCMNAQLPSIEVSTTPIKVLGYGPAEKRPTDIEFNPVTLTFIVDGNFSVLNTFHKWMQQVINYDASGGVLAKSGDKKVYEFGYKDDYASGMTVTVFSQNTGASRYVYTFRGLYPISVGELTPAWENGAEVMTLTVTFTYSEFSVSGSEAGDRSEEIMASQQKYTQNNVTSEELNRQLEADADARAASENDRTQSGETVDLEEETESSQASGTITGYTLVAVQDTPEYQAFYQESLSSKPGYPDNVERSLVTAARREAEASYKRGLIDGSIEPPEGSGIEVVRD